MLLGCVGQFRPLPAKQFQLAVDVVFNERNGLLLHLLAMGIDQLNAVIIVGIVAGRDHNAAVKLIHPGHIGDGRGGGDVEHVSIGTGRGQAGDQGVLKHITGAAGVLADHHTGRFGISVAALHFSVIPAQKAADFISMVCCQGYIGFTTEAVGSEIFTHIAISFTSWLR